MKEWFQLRNYFVAITPLIQQDSRAPLEFLLKSMSNICVKYFNLLTGTQEEKKELKTFLREKRKNQFMKT